MAQIVLHCPGGEKAGARECGGCHLYQKWIALRKTLARHKQDSEAHEPCYGHSSARVCMACNCPIPSIVNTKKKALL